MGNKQMAKGIQVFSHYGNATLNHNTSTRLESKGLTMPSVKKYVESLELLCLAGGFVK